MKKETTNFFTCPIYFQKVRFGKEEYAALKEFEKLHHVDIWAWIVDKVAFTCILKKMKKVPEKGGSLPFF